MNTFLKAGAFALATLTALPALAAETIRFAVTDIDGMESLQREMTDRGRIAPGLRADLVLLDWQEAAMPAPLRTFVSGRGGYSALPDTALADPARHPLPA